MEDKSDAKMRWEMIRLGEKPTGAFVLSLIGGGLLAVIAMALMIEGSLALVGGYELLMAAVIVIGASMMYARPVAARKWAVAVTAASILAGLNMLALGGGIWGMRWKPTQACARCGTKITAPSAFCSKCGASLPTVATQMVQAAQIRGPPTGITAQGKRFCTSCGSQIHEGAHFCPACGSRQLTLATP